MSDTQDEQMEPIYSQEEINSAREELKSFRPEDLLTLRGDLNRALAYQSMPEAVAIAWTEIFSVTGNKINLTCRGMSGRQALDELADTLRYARETYGMNIASRATAPTIAPQPVDATEGPVYVPDVQTASNLKVVDIDVVSITRERTRDGKSDFLRVKGGSFTKYGAPAYSQAFPQSLDVAKMTYGIEVSPSTGMTHAKIQAEVDNTGKMSHAKVIAFY